MYLQSTTYSPGRANFSPDLATKIIIPGIFQIDNLKSRKNGQETKKLTKLKFSSFSHFVRVGDGGKDKVRAEEQRSEGGIH